ncbi:unnamed protein product [Alopecurus aequalis]
MEKVEGLMKNLKLSVAENRSPRIRGIEERRTEEAELQAPGKLLSEKPPYLDGMTTTLGRIWGPLKGIRCKEMGDNVFLFTFLQASGKGKALDEGPWMFNKDLLVMQDFDPNKSLEEYEFVTIPIWVRVFKLPLGMMKRITGEHIRDEIGDYMEVEVGEDGMVVGEYLRVRIRMDIRKPIMRGITIHVGEKMLSKWFPYEYEYLPDFCFSCGIIGHSDRSCMLH